MGKQSPDWEVQCLTNNEALVLRDFGKSKFYRVRRGSAERRQDLLGGRGFPSKASKPCFLRQITKAELADSYRCVRIP